QSHTQSKGAVAEASAQDITPIWKRWPVVGAAILISSAVCFLVFLSFGGLDHESPVEEQSQTKSSVVDVPDTPAVERVPEGTPSKQVENDSDWFGPLD
ncbi:assembly protein, partial [Vibrio breoganii]